MATDQSHVNTPGVNRRLFLGSGIAAGISLMTGGFTLAKSRTALGAQSNSEKETSMKAWGREHLRGGESFILPSVKSDLTTLDEEGLRRDVRHAVSQGFCSIMPLPVGVDKKTTVSMYKIVADEAKGKILTVTLIQPGKWEEIAQRVGFLEKTGFSHALLYFPSKLPDQNAIYEQMRAIVENTSMGIILYAKPKDEIKTMDPTGLPIDAFDRLADHDNVIGVKFTQTLRPAAAYALAQRLGDRLQLGVIDLELMLPLSLKYKMQWTGQWAIDCLQSPENPWVNQFLNLLRQGENQKAYELYWKYEPVASAFYAMQEPSLKIGGHPWVHIKYMKWLTGGNGGLLPDLKVPESYVPHLDAQGRLKCRNAFESVGIKITDLPDEAFAVGNAAYEKGVRLKDLAATPQYVV